MINQEKRIHIMSAGQSVHETFPTVLNNISYVSKLYVIVEDRVYNSGKQEILDSIDKLKEIAAPYVDDGIEVVRIADDTLDYIRDAVLSIYEKNRDAKYYFNVSSGTKGLSIGLFMMALWIDAIPYHVGVDKDSRLIPIPKVHMNDFKKNPNRVTILEILNSKAGKYYAKKKLQQDLNAKYIPVKSGNKTKRTLSPTGFNSLISSLIDWKLIEKRFREGNEKEVEYCITPDGEFTLRFMKI